MFPNTLNFEDDICLNFPLPKGKIAQKWRDSKIDLKSESNELKYFSSKNFIETFYFKIRDFLNKNKIEAAIEKYNLYDFNIYHFDGGMDFFRDLRFAKELKRRGKKII